MRIIPNLGDATYAISNALVSARFVLITAAIAIALAMVFTLYC